MKKKILIGLLIFIIIIIVCLSINPIKKLIYEKEFIKNVQEYLLANFKNIENVEFSDEYKLHLNIFMDKNFEQLEFKEQETVIKNITNELNKYYTSYRDKINKIDYNINYNYGNIVFYIGDNEYHTSWVSDTIYKNNIEYKYEDYLKEKILVKYSLNSNDELYSSYLEAIDSTESLQEILLLENTEDVKMEIMYQLACKKMDTDDYKTSIELFEKLNSYKNSAELLNNLNSRFLLDGEWEGGIYDHSVPNFPISLTHKWIINGNNCYNVYNTEKIKNEYKQYYCYIENNILYIFNSEEDSNNKENVVFKMEYHYEKLSYAFTPGHESNNYLNKEFIINLTRVSDNIDLPSKIVIKEPSIGMTKKEAENSTWGKPKKINTTVTSYSTHEQWVYGNGRYLYFDDGILTSIQK